LTLDQAITETPFVFVDIETTGLDLRRDRIVEVAAIRVEPDGTESTFETLIHPGGLVAATHIHGIVDEDLVTAPSFSDIAQLFLDLVEGAVVVAYHADFDVDRLGAELTRVGVTWEPRYVCAMLLKALLGFGARRTTLAESCAELGAEARPLHTAASDAAACRALFDVLRGRLEQKRVRTMGDLKRLGGGYRFAKSLAESGAVFRTAPATRSAGPMPRTRLPELPLEDRLEAMRQARRTYDQALTAVLSDRTVSEEEVSYLLDLRRQLDLCEEEVRALHARAFLSLIVNFTADDFLDDSEVYRLREASKCLEQLGWSPGS